MTKKQRHSLATTPEEAEAYASAFTEFALAEMATGGPDHHLRIIAELGLDDPWLICCYAAPYNCPGGLAIHDRWPTPYDLGGVEDWLRENWRGLPIRKERRPARSPAKMAECLISSASWASRTLPGLVRADYETLWSSLSEIKYTGRYLGMKLLEGLRRAGVIEATMPDIRAGCGADWSPRLALSHMYPEYDGILNLNGTKAAAKWVNDMAAEVYRDRFSFIPDTYTFEVLLCDFKQHLEGKYDPGKPLRSELEHVRKVEAWPAFRGVDLSGIYRLREELFPHYLLEEITPDA